jgi:diacylglycerol kinase family enzyme
MKHVFIIDPKPFYGQQWKLDGLLDSLGQFFRTQDRPNFSTLVSKYPREAIGLVQKQIEEADDEWETVRVYAVGGDEILFDCLNAVAGLTNVELAVMPFGITNDFIRVFGEGSIELFKDIPSLVASTTTIPTDMISVGYSYAINGCTVGFTPSVSAKLKELTARLEKGFGRFTLGFQSFIGKLTSVFDKTIIAHQYKILIDDADYSGTYSQISIVNAPYFGRAKTGVTGAVPDDGLLDVSLFKAVRPLSLLRSLGKYSRGKIPSNCISVRAKKIMIKSDNPIWTQTDSELLLDTSINFEIVPGAVQIVSVNNLTYQKFQENA